MNAVYLLLMAFHVVGVLFNLRMLASCFRDKGKFVVLQKCRAVIIFQAILQLALLALNAEESLKAFSSEEEQAWCTTSSVFIISVGFVLIYNLLGMITIEYPSLLCLKSALSPQVAMVGTLIAGICTSAVFFWAGFFTVEELCASQIASTVACSLLLVLMLSIVWQICTHAEQDTTTTLPTTESSRNLLDLFSRNKTSVLVTGLFILCVALTLILEAISSAVDSFPDTTLFERTTFFESERVFYLYIMCFGVGIALPVIFQQLIDSSANEELNGNHSSDKMVII